MAGHNPACCRRTRQRFDWQPHGCTLRRFDPEHVCSILRGKAVLFVGDSTMENQFSSFVALAEAEPSYVAKGRHWASDKTAVACNGTTRLNFVRNDLSLWYQNPHDHPMSCNGSPSFLARSGGPFLGPFVRRAADASVLILGIGQHFAGEMHALSAHEAAIAQERAPDYHQPHTRTLHFFMASFNHTLASSTAARIAGRQRAIARTAGTAAQPQLADSAYRSDIAATTFVVGPSMPVPMCSRYVDGGPVELGDAVEAYTKALSGAGGERRFDTHGHIRFWQLNPSINEAGRWLAQAHGAAFLDVATPSLLRPDAARGIFYTRSRTGIEDCVHYCPGSGMYETWNTMLLNLLASRQPAIERAANGHTPGLFRIAESKLAGSSSRDSTYPATEGAVAVHRHTRIMLHKPRLFVFHAGFQAQAATFDPKAARCGLTHFDPCVWQINVITDPSLTRRSTPHSCEGCLGGPSAVTRKPPTLVAHAQSHRGASQIARCCQSARRPNVDAAGVQCAVVLGSDPLASRLLVSDSTDTSSNGSHRVCVPAGLSFSRRNKLWRPFGFSSSCHTCL